MVIELGKRLPPGGMSLQDALRDLVPSQIREELEGAKKAWNSAGKPRQVRRERRVWSDWWQRESVHSQLVWHDSYLVVNNVYQTCRRHLQERLKNEELVAAGGLGSLTGACWAVESADWRDPKIYLLPVNYGEAKQNRIVLPDKQELWQVRIYIGTEILRLATDANPIGAEPKVPSLNERTMQVLREMITLGELDPKHGGQARCIRQILERLELPPTQFRVIKSYVGPIWAGSVAKSEANRTNRLNK